MSFIRPVLAVVPFVVFGFAACSEVVEEVPAGGGGSTATTTTTTTTNAGGDGGTGGTIDNGHVSDVYPAPHPQPPHVINYGGPVLANPEIVPVFFANEAPAARTALEDFTAKIGGSSFWLATVAEYGVAAATATAPVELAENAPASIDDADIQTWLLGKLNGDDPQFPVATADSVYLLHYPAGTTITFGGGGQGVSCQDFGGYHSNVRLDAAHGSRLVAYAVLPRCANFGMSALDATTSASSHELIEAASDPYPMDDPAFASIDGAHAFWVRALGGGENADMCAQFDVYQTFPELAPHIVQRSWSNVAADAGHDPCVPQPNGSVYFNAAPELNDTVQTTFFGQTINVKGVKINVGETRVVTLDLFSDGPTGGPFNVDVQELSGQPHLTMSLDRNGGQNGEKLHLTITVNSIGNSKSAMFEVRSQLGQRTNVWFGIVGAPN